MMTSPTALAAADLTAYLHQSIPLTEAMALTLSAYDAQGLRLKLPLRPNRNDKGCAFGGSLASAMTLAGWSLASLTVAQAQLEAEVFIATSSLSYRLPVWSDCEARARLAEGETWERALRGLRQRGRGRIQLQADILLPDGRIAASMLGSYALLSPGQASKD
ncbi:YiiD C-terminal domain-containing protein [Frateuria aurantia]